MAATGSDQTVRFAHLSDVHLAPLPPLRLPDVNMKRSLGWLNWQRKRRFIHTRAALDAIVSDVHAQAPDHILVSGDLVNIGLPSEYKAALDWLRTLGPPDRVTVIPGNHDAYVAGDAELGIGRWRGYMETERANFQFGLSAGQAALMGGAFPILRIAGPVAIIGMNSGIVTPPGNATGRCGIDQLLLLAKVLDATKLAGLSRLVMIHHPPIPGLASKGRELLDAAALAMLLETHGADLVIHGHNHRMMSNLYAGIPIEGVASASAARLYGHEPAARYNLITVSRSGGGTAINIETRGLDTSGLRAGTIAHRQLPGHNTGASSKVPK
jgi:3',5'-cyclic AMP phosphodiesterase CpdA